MKKILTAVIFSVVAFSGATFAVEAPSKPTATPAASHVTPARLITTNQQDVVVNINTADAEALTKLKGIGPKKAEAIVAWRKANGNFKSIEQLAEVKGIGAKMLEENRKNIRI